MLNLFKFLLFVLHVICRWSDSFPYGIWKSGRNWNPQQGQMSYILLQSFVTVVPTEEKEGRCRVSDRM